MVNRTRLKAKALPHPIGNHRAWARLIPDFTSGRALWTVPTLIVLAMFVPTSPAQAQESLDIVFDASLGSGARLGTRGGETVTTRTPTYVGLDLGLIIARDTSVEWTMGAIVQIEDPAAALHPQVRLVKQVKSTKVIALVGAPYFVVPYRQLGLDFGGGAIIPMNDAIGLVALGTISVFFAGENLPPEPDSSLIVFNLGLGARVSF